MTVREALEKKRWFQVVATNAAQADAVRDFEVALREAYTAGWRGCNARSPHLPDRGVTAGIEALNHE